MDGTTLQLRGQIVDELQQRITDLNSQAQPIPVEWRDKLLTVAETNDPAIVQIVSDWIATLPPREYKAPDLSWQVFTAFHQDALDKLTLDAARLMLTGQDYSKAAQAISDMMAIRDSSATPQEAMDKLQTVTTNAATVALDSTISIGSANVAG